MTDQERAREIVEPLMTIELKCIELQSCGEDTARFAWPGQSNECFTICDDAGELAEFRPGRHYEFRIFAVVAIPQTTPAESDHVG